MECGLKRVEKKITTMTLIKFNKAHRGYSPVFPSLFQDVFDGNFPEFRMPGNGLPAVNIAESEQNYHLELTIPGFSKEELQIQLEENTLVVSGEKKKELEQNQPEKRYSRREFSYQNFKRTFTLPENVAEERIAAQFENGILKLDLPKKETPGKISRKIDLQ